VDAVMASAPVNNIALLVGDASGVRHVFRRGVMTENRNIAIASASKLIVGMTIWRLIEAGRLTPETRPQTLLPYWSDNPGDPRSQVTLNQLLGFTSGFASGFGETPCIGSAMISLTDCVRSIHDAGPSAVPGASFAYAPEHMQIAAAMVSAREGLRFETVMRDTLLTLFGLTGETRYPLLGGDNTRIAGSLRSTAAEYGRLLQALLGPDLIRDREGFLADRVGSLPIAFRPVAFDALGVDWHYGAGFWKVCNRPAYGPACEAEAVISSPGAFGFTPFVDFRTGYWAIIAMEEPLSGGADPSRTGVELQIRLQPLIAAAMTPD